MRKICLILFTLISINSYAQKGNNKLIAEYEDTLKIIAHKIMNAESEENRRIANDAFIINLNEVLKYERSFKFPFDSLVTISKVYAPDNTFRIFNWLLRKDNSTYEYYAFVHYNNKKRDRYELIRLTDNSANIRNPKQADLDATNWYGGLIYDIIYIKKKGRKYYTLLLWDGNDSYSTKKIIDVMYFSGKNKIKFGLPIFKKSKKISQKRVIVEYDSKTSVSLKYHQKNQKIVFNHLVPSRKDLEGLEEYYIPDGTFNEYKYQKGKWWLIQDIDIRNIQKLPKIKKPKRGLIPR